MIVYEWTVQECTEYESEDGPDLEVEENWFFDKLSDINKGLFPQKNHYLVLVRHYLDEEGSIEGRMWCNVTVNKDGAMELNEYFDYGLPGSTTPIKPPVKYRKEFERFSRKEFEKFSRG